MGASASELQASSLVYVKPMDNQPPGSTAECNVDQDTDKKAIRTVEVRPAAGAGPPGAVAAVYVIPAESVGTAAVCWSLSLAAPIPSVLPVKRR